MKRLLSSAVAFVASLALLGALLPVAAHAEDLDGGAYNVTYNAGGRMVDDYSSSEYISKTSSMQPGDTITFTVNTIHENDTTADWYLTNEVVKSLEEGDAQGSAYGYELTFEGPNNSRTLYQSERVGGTDSAAGLADATNALDSEEYLFLDTFAKGQTGVVTLKVSLDGETEGNAYFNTLARVKMAFAVEENVDGDTPTPGTTTTTTRRTASARTRRVLAKTGDPTSNLPLYLAAIGGGVLCIALAVRRRRSQDENDEEGQE